MKAFFQHSTAIVLTAFAFIIIAGESTIVYAQDASGIRPAYGPAVVRVKVIERANYGRSDERSRVIAEAAGFSAEGCILVPFDVVAMYESRQTWSNIDQRIEVFLDGQSKPHEGRLRNLGVMPLNLDLACIDLAPLSTDDRAFIFPLPLESTSADLLYGALIPLGTKPGTPLLNSKGRVVGMFISGAGDSALLIPAPNILRFLREARKVPSAWPTLLVRP